MKLMFLVAELHNRKFKFVAGVSRGMLTDNDELSYLRHFFGVPLSFLLHRVYVYLDSLRVT